MESENATQKSSGLKDWPDEDLERVISCPVCGAGERFLLYSGLEDRVFCSAPGRWDMYQCSECRCAYLDPRPSLASIHLAYRNYYTHNKQCSSSVDLLSLLKSLARVLANGYLNYQYGYKFFPTSRFGERIVPLLPSFQRALHRQMRYLPQARLGARLLDVGFGSGEFMRLARRIGWHVSGVDFDPVVVANASECGLNVYHGDLCSFDEVQDSFDAITINHVLEHVSDPGEMISSAYRLLKPGGMLFIETPNIDAYGHMRFRENWRGLEVPRHLVLFNWESVIGLLNKVGFVELQKIVRFAPYSGMARASRSIHGRINSLADFVLKYFDVITGICLENFSILDDSKTEFITICARK